VGLESWRERDQFLYKQVAMNYVRHTQQSTAGVLEHATEKTVGPLCISLEAQLRRQTIVQDIREGKFLVCRYLFSISCKYFFRKF
jgi:hypothetical protein